MKRWFHLTIVALISVLVLAACGDDTTDGNGDGESYVVGASQIVEHPSLNNAYEGFKDTIEAAGLDVEFKFESAQNDPNNVKPISDGFVADGVDLIFANSTPSALGAFEATNDIPILFTSVTDADEAGYEPGENMTGVLDLHPDAIKETVQFIDTYFQDSTVGLIYNPGEPNSVTQIEAVEEAAEGTSLSLQEAAVSNGSEVLQAAQSLLADIDVFYIITDNTVVEALDSVISVANDQEIPLIVGEPDSVKKGGFATFGIDYYTIGERTGEMAVEILTGEKTVQDFDVEYPPEIQLFINKEAAEAQNIEWNSDWDENAQIVEQEE